MEPDPHPSLWPHAVYAIRRAGAGRPLAECVVAIANTLPDVLGTDPFTWDLDPEPPRQITLDTVAVAKRLRGAFMLGDRPAGWTAMLSASTPYAPPGIARQDVVSLTLPGPRERPLVELDGMMTLVERIAGELSAHIAYAHDSALGHAYHGRRLLERSRELIPPAIRDQMPVETYHPLPGLAGALPALRPDVELDDTLVPAGVYWINWWSAGIVDAIGREKVTAAGWARIATHPDGAMTLVATIAPPDPTSAADVSQLAHLIGALDLVAVQDRHRR